MKKNKHLELYTDGSCLGNPGAGGWAAILIYNNIEKVITGGAKSTTNNQMELLAIVEALSILKEPCDVTIHTDSQYCSNAILKGWLESWIQNGWKTATKKPVKNQDLWIKLIQLMDYHHIRFQWVEGHAGDEYNERCDKLARQTATKFKNQD